jgi:hypothetical protein
MKRSAILVVALLGVGVLFAAGTGTASSYSVSVSGETDVPSWTFEVDGDTYTANSVAIVSGGDISFTTTGPSNSSYNAYLYDREGNIVQQRQLEGNDAGSFSASCSSCSPGTYLVAVSSDDGIEDAKPVIIEGHSVSISAPSSVDTNSTATVNITTSGSPSSVELIIGQDNPTRIDAEGSGGEYTATIDGSKFDTGQYTLYGATLNGDELTGLSNSASLSVEEADSSSGTEDGSSGGGGSSGGSTAPASSAEFNVTDARINTTSIDAGEAVAVTLTVENVGDTGGEYEARVRTNDETVASGTVEIAEGDSKEVTLVTTFNSAGEFDLTVDDYGDLATLTVEGSATVTPGTRTATATSTETATTTDSPTPTDSGVITPNNGTASPTESDGAAPTIPFVVAVVSAVGIWLRRRGR